MHYLIDGYNFLFFLEDVNSSKIEREEVIELLQTLVGKTKIQFTLVFDGSHIFGEESGRQYNDPLEIAYSSKGQSADEYILEQVSHTLYPAKYTVVTSDKGLTRAVKSVGANTMKNLSFLRWIQKKTETIEREKFETENEAEFERLLKEFESRLKDPYK